MNALLHKIQDIETEMLSYLLDICRKYDLNIYLWGGSLLGAVRHQGFIPWDDDLDIVMMRKDFEKLKQAILSNPNERYELILPDNSQSFIDFIPRLTYRNSFLGSQGPLQNEQSRIHLDFFLVDNTANQKWKRKLHILLLRVFYGLAMGHRTDQQFSNRFNYSNTEIIAARFLSFIGKHIPYSTVKKFHLKTARLFDSKATQYMLCTNNVPTCLKETHSHPTSAYNKTNWVPFGQIKAPIMDGYDILLTNGYGDYMQLPPPEQRKPVHILSSKIIIDGEQWTSCEEKDGKKETTKSSLR